MKMEKNNFEAPSQWTTRPIVIFRSKKI